MKQKKEMREKTNNLNVLTLPKERMNIKKLNFEKFNKLFNEGKSVYWCDSIVYGQRMVPTWKIKQGDETFTIIIDHKLEGIVFICSFYTFGHSFFLESKNLAESLQIYKATQDRDYYFTLNEIIDKKNRNWKSREEVFNKKELQNYLKEYFEGKKSSIISGYDDSIGEGLFEFIKRS